MSSLSYLACGDSQFGRQKKARTCSVQNYNIFIYSKIMLWERERDMYIVQFFLCKSVLNVMSVMLKHCLKKDVVPCMLKLKTKPSGLEIYIALKM